MTETPIDPMMLVNTLVSAWNKGMANPVAAPSGLASSPGQGHAEIIARLALIEERLLRIEALAMAAATERAPKPKKSRS